MPFPHILQRCTPHHATTQHNVAQHSTAQQTTPHHTTLQHTTPNSTTTQHTTTPHHTAQEAPLPTAPCSISSLEERCLGQLKKQGVQTSGPSSPRQHTSRHTARVQTYSPLFCIFLFARHCGHCLLVTAPSAHTATAQPGDHGDRGHGGCHGNARVDGGATRVQAPPLPCDTCLHRLQGTSGFQRGAGSQ